MSTKLNIFSSLFFCTSFLTSLCCFCQEVVDCGFINYEISLNDVQPYPSSLLIEFNNEERTMSINYMNTIRMCTNRNLESNEFEFFLKSGDIQGKIIDVEDWITGDLQGASLERLKKDTSILGYKCFCIHVKYGALLLAELFITEFYCLGQRILISPLSEMKGIPLEINFYNDSGEVKYKATDIRLGNCGREELKFIDYPEMLIDEFTRLAGTIGDIYKLFGIFRP